MPNVAIIPARKGSKRLKGKNRLLLQDKPLVAWTIESAIESNVFDEIILSTDAIEILDIGHSYGLKDFGLRPSALSSDHATAADVIAFYADNFQESLFCYLQPTSPLRSKKHIVDSYKLLRSEKANAIVSVSPLKIPVPWIYQDDIDFSWFLNNLSFARSQDHKNAYYLNGAIYWFSGADFISHGSHLGIPNTLPFVMEYPYGLDIDNKEDFDLAEMLLNQSSLQNFKI